MFCAVTYGGCGGSSNLASISDTSGGTSQPVSGDTSGGRGDLDDWEVIPDPDDKPAGEGWEQVSKLTMLNGMNWEISYSSMYEADTMTRCTFVRNSYNVTRFTTVFYDGMLFWKTSEQAYDAPITAQFINSNGEVITAPLFRPAEGFTETPSGPYNYEIELDEEGYEAIEVVGAYPYKQIGIFNEFYVNGVRYYANVTLRNTDQ